MGLNVGFVERRDGVCVGLIVGESVVGAVVVCRRDGISVGLPDSREEGLLVEVGVVVG